MSILSDALERTKRAATRRMLPVLLGDRFDPATVNPAAARHVSLFPQIGLGYNRVKKNANSTTVSILTELGTGRRLEDQSAKRSLRHLESASWPELRRARDMHFFVITRDPYSRVLSAFLNKFAKDSYQSDFRAFPLDRGGFSDFLKWLADGALTKDPHWDAQHKLIFAPLSAYDSVLRFEEFPDCFIDLLTRREIPVGRDLAQRMGQVNSQTRTRASAKLAEFYTPAAEALVTDLFASDFDLLSYKRGLSPKPVAAELTS
ncbi:sulfotransferase family 2 domain-containing protein [Paragemmobacter straminiformis]|uniref:Sulfotransferase family 2 domain-containing protein n=1 Tax=Paragemmobacter straminiformis TaxID=2045119 RepID=A0A842I951_9RHOB|nr:sulfotransferase family 2 domain-containing protein [Gemmobacter straminiformis]MBC2836159.1 sulfotransferase family 2 domain-containing protein [Gemmobacter straminiformis]